MKSVFIAAPLLAVISQAAPVVPRDNIDATVLQFALTLEHLENVFYKQALSNFSVEDFEGAGYSKDYYNNLMYIAHDEEQHVQLLSGALTQAGVTPVQACKYNFPYTDVPSFITLSSVLEGVGTSAYLGGAPLITSKAYLSVAASILVSEALHTSLQRLATYEVPFANPYGTPLDPTSVYTLAAAFITSCPPSNPPLPFKPYPGLSVDGKTCLAEEPETYNPSVLVRRDGIMAWHKATSLCSAPTGGSTVSFTAASEIPAGSYATFVSGLSVVSVGIPSNGDSCNTVSITIPTVAEGQTYVFITSKDVEGTLDNSAILFGPAILEVAPQPPTYDSTIL